MKGKKLFKIAVILGTLGTLGILMLLVLVKSALHIKAQFLRY